jgi:hypothetical protein
MAPNFNSVPAALVNPMGSNAIVPVQLPQVNSSAIDENMATLRSELQKMFYDNFGIEPKPVSRMYQKPYPEYFDALPYPQGYKVPDFAKFNGVDNKTTWEHVSQYLAQLGEAGNTDPLKVRLFPLSLAGTAFSWFSALPYGSINTWYHLEKKFHEHFYSGDNELKLSHLTSVRQKHDESVTDYIKRFRDTKNRCYSLVVTERDMADLVLNGLRTHIKERIEGYEYLSISQVLQRALAQESRSKETKDLHRSKSDRPRINTVEYNSDNSDDEADIYAAEFVWPSKAKPYTCDALKPIRKNREDEMTFSFDVAKCDRIFDAMLKDKYIRLSHTLPPFEELKRRAYCKYHNSFSHATNDCNVFRRQIQSAINDGRLSFADMQIDKQPFPMNTLELQGKRS